MISNPIDPQRIITTDLTYTFFCANIFNEVRASYSVSPTLESKIPRLSLDLFPNPEAINMHISTLLHFFSLVAVGCTSPSPLKGYVVHERRDVLPSGFAIRERLDPGVRLPLRIGLKQRNLHLASRFLDEVSHPQSKNYARYWTPQEVVDKFSPK